MIRIMSLHDEPILLNVDKLQEECYREMSFHRGILNNLDFRGATFRSVDFRSAEMNDAIFGSTLFYNSKLIMVNAQRSIFDNCEMTDTLLLHSDFTNSSLKNTNLSKCSIKNVVFLNCDLRGANLSCKGLESCVLDGAIYDEMTVWNECFHVNDYNMIKVER